MGEWLIFDTEANGLLDQATKLHSIQCGAVDTDETTIYCDALPGYPSIAEGLARLAAAEKLIGHNLIGYDLPLIEKLYPGTIRLDQCIDTLILARLSDPEERQNALEEWGNRLGVLKGSFNGPWEICTQEMIDYARQDVVVTRALWGRLKGIMEWGPVVDVEHRFAHIIHLQIQNGFTLDVSAAQALDAELRGDVAAEVARLQDVFPPIWVMDGKEPFTPKRNDKAKGWTAGVPFSRVKIQEFNPTSRRQVAARLMKLGWKPRAFGADGTPTVDETVLSNLPYPEARQLVRVFTLTKQLGQLSDGKTAWLKLVTPAGKVHGRVNTIGCAPGRCAHSGPNMGQVNKKDLRMRAVWTSRPGWVLVGCDAEGLQARGLASYLTRYDGGAYAKKILEGKKSDKTDEHSSNLKEIPFLNAGFKADHAIFNKARDHCKRLLYGVWFGAQDPKLGKTIKEGCRECGFPVPKVPDKELGAMARQALFRAIRGFEQLVAALQVAIKRGYLKGPSGRQVKIRSKHSALVFLLQAVEADVMKTADVIWHYEVAPVNGWAHGVDFAYTAHVHDERQLECRPEIAEEIGKAYAKCITEAGERLGLKCPLAGSYAIGPNWAATH